MKRLYIISVACILGFAFLVYGRSIYMPAVHKVLGKETIESVIEKIEKPAWSRIESHMHAAGFKEGYPQEIFLIGLKEERRLQLYAKDQTGIKAIKDYPFTAFSGKLGPKQKEGDRQIPEGVYYIDYLNPNSAYYLSIKIKYPNEFDKSNTRFTTLEEMGGDIFIHGKAATIGCIPIGDEAIEEVFLLVHKARSTKVILSPRDFRVNDEYPQIDLIGWENNLYDIIKKELEVFPVID